MSESKNNKSKNTLLLLTGAIAGAAATYYLHTPKGKELTQKIANKGKEFGSSISDKAQSIADEVKDNASKAISIAAEKLDAAKESLESHTTELIDNSDHNISSFQQGVNKAKEAVINGVSGS